MINQIKRRLPPKFFKDVFLDLEDRCRAEALKAFELVRDHAGLDAKRSRELEGQARFRMMEKGFHEVCELHGGRLIANGLIPSTDMKVFQPFMRFEIEGQGIILGLAAMSEPGKLPVKNKSRLAGVSLNYHLQPSFDLGESSAKIGDIFVSFLVSRDRETAGRLEEIAVGVISSKYDQFLSYQSLDKYLEGHADTPAREPLAPKSSGAKLRLKREAKPFVPPEAPTVEEGTGNQQK